MMLSHALASQGCVWWSLFATIAATEVCLMVLKALRISILSIQRLNPQSLAILAILLINDDKEFACLLA